MIKRKKLNGQFLCVRRLNAGLASGPEEPLQPRVPEALDHLLSVAHHASGAQSGPSVDAHSHSTTKHNRRSFDSSPSSAAADS